MKRNKCNKIKLAIIAILFSLNGCSSQDQSSDGNERDTLTSDCTTACEKNSSSAEPSELKKLDFQEENVIVTTLNNGSGYHAFGDTKVFAYFPDKNVVVGVKLTSISEKIELIGNVYIFHELGNQEQISHWINNQRTGTVAQTSVPDPSAVYSIPQDSLSVTSVSLEDQISGASGDQYNQYQATFFISDTVLDDTYLLNNFSAEAAVYERTQDIASIDHSITVQTVDSAGQPLSVDGLSWYYVGKNDDLFELTWSWLECQISNCSLWELKVEVPGVVHIEASKVVEPHVDGCSSDLSGDTEITIEPDKEQIVNLIVAKPGAICP